MVVSFTIFFYHRYLGKIPNLTSILFTWLKTTNLFTDLLPVLRDNFQNWVDWVEPNGANIDSCLPPPEGYLNFPLDAKKIHHPPRNVSGWTVIQYLDAPYGKRNSWPQICGETKSEVDFSRERTSECILMGFLGAR